MSIPNSCKHERFQVQNQVARLLVPMTDRVEFMFVVRVWCRDCGVEFGFKGIECTEGNPDQPWIGAYGTTLRAPLAPALLAPRYGEKPKIIMEGS